MKTLKDLITEFCDEVQTLQSDYELANFDYKARKISAGALLEARSTYSRSTSKAKKDFQAAIESAFFRLTY